MFHFSSLFLFYVKEKFKFELLSEILLFLLLLLTSMNALDSEGSVTVLLFLCLIV